LGRRKNSLWNLRLLTRPLVTVALTLLVTARAQATAPATVSVDITAEATVLVDITVGVTVLVVTPKVSSPRPLLPRADTQPPLLLLLVTVLQRSPKDMGPLLLQLAMELLQFKLAMELLHLQKAMEPLLKLAMEAGIDNRWATKRDTNKRDRGSST